MFIFNMTQVKLVGLPWGINGKEFTCQAEDDSLIPGSERSPGGGNGNPFQYSCLGNPMDRGALVGYNPQGHKRVRPDLVTKQQTKN